MLSMGNRLRLLALGLVAFTAALVGWVVFQGYGQLTDQHRHESLKERVDGEALRFESGFLGFGHDTLLLSKLPALTNLASELSQASGASPARIESFRIELTQVFSAVMESKPYTTQLRFIGVADGGREVVRMNRVDGMLQAVAEDDLQRKGTRDYFEDTARLAQGEIYFSRISLNREQGRIDVPHVPTLRTATPIYFGDALAGMVVINFDFSQFVETLFPSGPSGLQFFLTNDNGDYLVHPDAGRTFGFDLGERHLLQADYPAFAPLMRDQQNNALAEATVATDNQLIRFKRTHPYPEAPGRFLLFGLADNFAGAAASSRDIALRAMILSVVLVIGAAIAAYYLATRLSTPINQITQVANQIAMGANGTRLPLDRGDEIGTLARAFNHMLQSLSRNEQRLTSTAESLGRANRDLEHFAHIASHDLREPARRVVALSDMLAIDEGAGLSAENSELIGRIKRSANQMLDQIDAFRAFARLGNADLMRERTDLGKLVRKVLTEFEDDIQQRGVQVEMDPLPTLPVYPELLESLYRNLVGNSLIHTQGGAFRLKFTASESGGITELGVHNTGSRIDVDQLESVFRPFKRLSGDAPGSGLGLAICARIVDRHSGRISAESGADFVWFKFTLSKEH